MGDTSAWEATPLLDVLFEDTHAGRCLAAPDGTVLRAAREWLRATGSTLDQVLGANVADLFPPASIDLRALRDRVRAGELVEFPMYRRVVGGREVWLAGWLAPVPLPGGTGVLISAVDVAERRHLEDVLRETGDRFSEDLTDRKRREEALLRPP